MGFNSGFKELNTELNPICHLLALLGAHPILQVSRKGVKLWKKHNVQEQYITFWEERGTL